MNDDWQTRALEILAAYTAKYQRVRAIADLLYTGGFERWFVCPDELLDGLTPEQVAREPGGWDRLLTLLDFDFDSWQS